MTVALDEFEENKNLSVIILKLLVVGEEANDDYFCIILMLRAQVVKFAKIGKDNFFVIVLFLANTNGSESLEQLIDTRDGTSVMVVATWKNFVSKSVVLRSQLSTFVAVKGKQIAVYKSANYVKFSIAGLPSETIIIIMRISMKRTFFLGGLRYEPMVFC